MNLSELREGQTASIVRIQGEGPFRRRLLEMGFLRGTEVDGFSAWHRGLR
jgi:ferrous iron transport protein B